MVGAGNPATVRGAPVSITGIMAVTFLARSDQAVVLTTFPLAAKAQLGYSATAIGLLAAATGLAAAATARYVASRLAGRTVVLGAMAGLAIMASTTLSLALHPGSVAFCGAVVAAGVGMGLCSPCLMTMAGYASSRARRSYRSSAPGPGTDLAGRAGSTSGIAEKNIARYAIMLSASFFLGPLLESLVLDLSHQSYATVFWTFLPVPVVATAAVAVLARRFVTTKQEAEAGPAGSGASTPPGIERAFRLALMILVMCEIPFGSVIYFGGVMARSDYHASKAAVAMMFAGYFALSLLTRIVYASRAPILHKARLAKVCFAVLACGMGLVVGVHGIAAMAVAMMVLGCADGLTYTLGLTLVTQYAPPEARTHYNSRYTMVENGSAALIPPVVGVLISSFGYHWSFALMIVAVVAVGVPASLYRIDRSADRSVWRFETP